MLFSSVAGLGSLHPLIALAREAKAAGHDVAIATSDLQGSMIERVGFRFFPAGPSPLAEMRRRYPNVPIPPIDDETRRQVFELMFGGVYVEMMLPGILDACRAWRPDIVVRAHLALAPLVAAEEFDIPHATIEEYAAGELADNEAIFARALAKWQKERGMSPDPVRSSLRRYLWLVPFPASLRHMEAPFGFTARRTQPLIFTESQNATPPGWLEALPDGPLVHISLGTFARRPELLSVIVDALAHEPITVVIATGAPGMAEALGTLPANVIAVPYVSHSLLLPRCSAFITHAGAGSLIGGIMSGVPMVFVPLFGDQPLNASCAEAAGTGLMLDADTLSAKSIRDATRAVLDDIQYRQSVRRVREEALALPNHREAVSWLEHVALHREPPAT
jgi:MGT family glycosyltransferase